LTTIDLRPPKLDIKFNVGSSISHTFFYVDSSYTPINISAWAAYMQARLSYTTTAKALDLDTLFKGGLSVVQATTSLTDLLVIPGEKVIYSGLVIPNCYGIKLDITSTQTALLTPEVSLVYDIELVSTTPLTYAFLRGSLIPYYEVTK
jgi:hypothetical protein